MDFEALDRQLKQIDCSFKRINWGGCGKFAQALGGMLEKRGYRVKYVLLSSCCGKPLDNIKKFSQFNRREANRLLENRHPTWNVQHIMVCCNGHYMDSTGVYSGFAATPWPSDGYRVSGLIPKQVLNYWCKRDNGWNHEFDSSNMPLIRKAINKIQL